MSTPTRLLVLGTGTMAKSHAERFAQIPGCVLVGAVDVNPERARAYAATYNIPGVFDDLDAAIRWGGFDAAINATPDAAHKPTTLQLIAAGKSVLCEKPLAVNAADAFAMTEAAEAAGVIAMVNLSCRNAPAIQQARQMVNAGEIGTVRHTEASYLQELADCKLLGRLARRGALALAPFDRSRIERRAWRPRHPSARCR